LANVAVKEEKAINQIYQKLSNSVNTKGYGSMIVCGGRSPVTLFKKLSYLELPWEKIKIILVDDRLVDSESEDSNESLLYKYLLCNNAIDAEYISLKNEASRVLSIADKFDIAILGFGNDGHFASLFPSQLNHRNAFDVNTAPDFIISDQPLGSPSYKRISMNLSMLLNTKRCILLVPNKDKRIIVDQAYVDNKIPLHFLLTQDKIMVECSDIHF